MKIQIATLAAVASLAATTSAWAHDFDDDGYYEYRIRQERRYFEPPQVIYTAPVYEPPVVTYAPTSEYPQYQGNRAVGQIGGAVAGAVIGSRFGKRDGRVISTAVGSVVGAMIGGRLSR